MEQLQAIVLPDFRAVTALKPRSRAGRGSSTPGAGGTTAAGRREADRELGRGHEYLRP